ncbi:hypothetical protein FNF31_02775 [Cafeteria roenbergensis]|uniref:Uncharacterized protein n=2 Tax=Cafeteria roenbergensis TaxID=33653 RepID=A0A5A8DG85_CAFRO|nr:hypothetical protein FNF31_02775 [Cafeteria roenbergensis]
MLLWTRSPATAEAALRACGCTAVAEAMPLGVGASSAAAAAGATADSELATEADLEAYRRHVDRGKSGPADGPTSRSVEAERLRAHGRFFVAAGQADVLAAAAALAEDVAAEGRILGRPPWAAPREPPSLRSTHPFLHGAETRSAVRCRRLAGSGDWMAVVSPCAPGAGPRLAAAAALRQSSAVQLLGHSLDPGARVLSAEARYRDPGLRLARVTLLAAFAALPAGPFAPTAGQDAAAAALRAVEVGWACRAPTTAGGAEVAVVPVLSGVCSLCRQEAGGHSAGQTPVAEMADEDDEAWLEGLLADDAGPGDVPTSEKAGHDGAERQPPRTGDAAADAATDRVLREAQLAWQ